LLTDRDRVPQLDGPPDSGLYRWQPDENEKIKMESIECPFRLIKDHLGTNLDGGISRITGSIVMDLVV
jgi:hypothetical protein